MDLESRADWITVTQLIANGTKFSHFRNYMSFFTLEEPEEDNPNFRNILVDLSRSSSIDHPSLVPGCDIFISLSVRYSNLLRVYIRLQSELFTLNKRKNEWMKVRTPKKILSSASRSGVDLETLRDSNQPRLI